MSEGGAASTSDRFGREVAALVADLRGWAGPLDPSTVHTPPAPGSWTVAQNLAHIAEFVPYWAGQALLVAKNPGSPFGRTEEDPDRRAGIADHADDDLGSLLSRVEAAEERFATTIAGIPDDAWSSTGVHPRFGDMDIGAIIDRFVVQHLVGHLEQARAASPATT